jgi:glycosyltransferase involved in cell wall biosynthesis
MVKNKATELHNLDNNKIIVIPPGVNDVYLKCETTKEEARKELGFRTDDFIVLTVCRLVQRKGVDNTIKAVKMLTNIKGLKHIIVGDGPELIRLKKLVCDLRLNNIVSFVGEIRDPNILHIV